MDVVGLVISSQGLDFHIYVLIDRLLERFFSRRDKFWYKFNIGT